jgi:hypothetical protein
MKNLKEIINSQQKVIRNLLSAQKKNMIKVLKNLLKVQINRTRAQKSLLNVKEILLKTQKYLKVPSSLAKSEGIWEDLQKVNYLQNK